MKEITALDEYMGKVYKLVILLATSCTLIAAVLFSGLKLMGYYTTMAWPPTLIFVGTCLGYFTIGMIFRLNCMENGRLKPKWFVGGKIFLVCVILIQYNFITYLVPSRDWWGFAYFFLIWAGFFLDRKMLAITTVGMAISFFAAWFIKSGPVLPVQDELFVPDVVLRIVYLIVSFAQINILIMFVRKFLGNAKRDELERSNNRVVTVMDKVHQLSQKLHSASRTLMTAVQNQQVITGDLAAISRDLLENNSKMLQKSNENSGNLMNLDKARQNIENELDTVDRTAKELEAISENNEKSIRTLVDMSETVEKSTKDTIEVAEKLLNETSEIEKTLDIIHKIALNTNILALNAQVEAARSSRSGKGFAVIAQEVKNLADNTKASLKDINEIVSRVQKGSANVTSYMNHNVEQLQIQNDVLRQTVSDVSDMLHLLKQSVEASSYVYKLSADQNAVIEITITMNEDIARDISNEHARFSEIAGLAQRNLKDISMLSQQADALNDMIVELDELMQG